MRWRVEKGDVLGWNLSTYTKRLLVNLDASYGKMDLNKVMKNKFQHLTETQRNELIELLQNFEELFDETIGTWKIDPVDFELK